VHLYRSRERQAHSAARVPDPIIPPLRPANRLDLLLFPLDPETAGSALCVRVRIVRRARFEIQELERLVDPCAQPVGQLCADIEMVNLAHRPCSIILHVSASLAKKRRVFDGPPSSALRAVGVHV
jgi:hypothetical protein